MRKQHRPRVIYLIGTSGNPNFGDELITAAWLRFWAREAPDAEVWLDSPRPGPSAVLFDGLHPGLRCVDTLFHATWNAPVDSAAATIEFGARVVGEPGLIPREASGVDLLQRVDLVQIIGGGYINRMWPHHLALLGAARGMAERYRARTALTGAGLTPIVSGSESAMVEVLRAFDVVDVRDSASFDVVRQLNQVTDTGDDALLGLPDVALNRARRERTYICVQSDILDHELADVADFVVRTMKSWSVDKSPALVVECMPPDDGRVLQLLQPHLPRLSFLPFSELWRHGFPVTPGARWITTRFHPHLIGEAVGNRGVAIAPSSGYYATKHQSLAELGSGWSVVESLAEEPDAPPGGRPPFGGALADLQARKMSLAKRVSGLLPDR